MNMIPELFTITDYWERLNAEARRFVLMVSKAVFVAMHATDKLPPRYSEKSFGTRHLLLYLTLLGQNSTAYRRLTVREFSIAQQCLENFVWREFPHIPELINGLDDIGMSYPSNEELLKIAEKTLHLDLIDACDYAAEEKFGKFDIYINKKLGANDIKSHHLLLSSLSDCACCPFDPTDAAKIAFANNAPDFYYSARWPKVPVGEEEWLGSSLLVINKHGGQLRAFLQRAYGTFDEIGQRECKGQIASRLFLQCNPPIFIKNELTEFNTIINNAVATREKDLQLFLENHSQFLRILGFNGFRPQVRLSMAKDSAESKNISLAPDFIVEQIVGNQHAVIEIKKATARMTSGSKRQSFSANLAMALRQLEDYYTFFQDSENRSWFKDVYGSEIREPDLVLVIGNELVSNLGLSSTVHSPIKNLPVRLVSYRDIELLAKAQGILVESNTSELEI